MIKGLANECDGTFGSQQYELIQNEQMNLDILSGVILRVAIESRDRLRAKIAARKRGYDLE
ncbi:MAG: hypothetical protein ACXWMF_12755 [Syntrophales bacterium]